MVEEWCSYKTVCDRHGEALVAAMVAMGKMTTRPHGSLDPTHEMYELIPENDRLQYQEVTKQTIGEEAHAEGVDKSTNGLPEENAETTQEEQEFKSCIQRARKARSVYQAANVDIKIKLGKIEGNRLL